MTSVEILLIIICTYLIFQIFMGGLFITVIGANNDAFDIIDFRLFNPIQLYKKTKLNRVGAWIVGIGAGIIFPVWAIPYWIYKALTAGR